MKSITTRNCNHRLRDNDKKSLTNVIRCKISLHMSDYTEGIQARIARSENFGYEWLHKERILCLSIQLTNSCKK